MVGMLELSSGWRRDLADFRRRCEDSRPEDENDLIREAFALFARVPPSWGLNLCRIGPARLEAMLATGAPGSAVLALLDTDINFMASRGRRCLYFATVVLPGQKTEVSAAADTMATALLAAVAAALGDIALSRPLRA